MTGLHFRILRRCYYLLEVNSNEDSWRSIGWLFVRVNFIQRRSSSRLSMLEVMKISLLIKLKKSTPATEILTFFTRVKINAIMFWKQRRPSFSEFVSFFIQLWLSFGEWKWRHPWKKQHITWRSLGNPCWRSHNVLVVRKTFGDHFVTKNHLTIKKYFSSSLK